MKLGESIQSLELKLIKILLLVIILVALLRPLSQIFVDQIFFGLTLDQRETLNSLVVYISTAIPFFLIQFFVGRFFLVKAATRYLYMSSTLPAFFTILVALIYLKLSLWPGTLLLVVSVYTSTFSFISYKLYNWHENNSVWLPFGLFLSFLQLGLLL